ncbi:hypothetical protein N665_0848s0008 [Sinapis alba]|nr:hypothetical protein N665_0848s0008 [Sinapis alba]
MEDSWSYGTSVFLPNGTTFLPSDSFPENPISMSGFQQGLSNGFDKDDVNGFSAVSSSSCVVPSSLLHADGDENQSSSSNLMDYGGGTSSRDFTLPAKKPRASNSPLCQVYGCNMDLSSSKDYHKRHRVCETHSKTSVVIVNGIEQRFCQQCSRFHFMSEFDDVKRSCRRRLAGHNERRRKPSFCFLPGKQQRHKLLHSSQESFPGSFLYRVMDEQHHSRGNRLLSFKDEPAQNYTYSPEASGVSSIWYLHEAVSRSTCAHSLLSAQSQQHLSETPNESFSITQPNQTLNASTIGYHHQMQPPLRTELGKIKTSASSSTVGLLQLSSHLQRIEQQQWSFTNDVKQEYNNEHYFPSS